VNLDTALWFSCNCAEIFAIGLLLSRRLWRSFPLFLAYNLWGFLGNAATFAVLQRYPPNSSTYLSVYLINVLVDSILLFGVLVELAWSVLRPLRGSLPRIALLVVSVLILAVGAAIWPFTTVPSHSAGRELILLFRLQQSVSILSVVAFLILAAGSQLLSISLRNRELQIATGLGLYSLVGVVVTVLHTKPEWVKQYNRLDELVVAAFLCSLLYWIFSFAQQEQERRQMTPQMQTFLLAMAGAARTNRVALADSRSRPENEQK
jgi:hypothetical protein